VSEDYPVRLVLKGFLVLLAWLVLSVPLGILVGKVLKASREAMELQAHRDLRALQESRERRERQERLAPLDPRVRRTGT
jgi:hypothetical protein